MPIFRPKCMQHACKPNARTHTSSRMRTNSLTHVPTSYTAAPAARAGGVCASPIRIRRRLTPLHVAAAQGHADVAAALLTHGADVHAKTDSGCGGRTGTVGCTHTDACVRAHARTRAHACTRDGARGIARRHAPPVATRVSIP
jgi:hypothetical protein